MNLHISPSLQTLGRWANEVKFAVSPEQAVEVLDWASYHMVEDIHCQAAEGGYLTTTLYLDTPEFGVYHKIKGCRVSKHRIRRYGDSDRIYLEQKRKRGSRVTKRRVEADAELLKNLCPCCLPDNAPQAWFCHAIERKDLHPVALVSYQRTAFNALVGPDAVRLTLDREILARPCRDWKVERVYEGLAVNPNTWVLEIKFPDALPVLFKRLLEEHKLVQSGFSKYRSACEAMWDLNRLEESCRAS